MEHLGEDTAKWNKKPLTTFMHRLAEPYARNEREDSKSQAMKLVQVTSRNVKATLSGPLAEEQWGFKIGQVHSLDPLGHSRLRYDQPEDTYSTNPTGVAVDVMNGRSLLIEFGATVDVLKHTGCLGDTAYWQVCREGWLYCIQQDRRKMAF